MIMNESVRTVEDSVCFLVQMPWFFLPSAQIFPFKTPPLFSFVTERDLKALLIWFLVSLCFWTGQSASVSWRWRNSVMSTSFTLSQYFSMPTLDIIWSRKVPTRWCWMEVGSCISKNSSTNFLNDTEHLLLRMLNSSAWIVSSLSSRSKEVWNRCRPLVCCYLKDGMVMLEWSASFSLKMTAQ